ncbi:MAG: CoA transferase, partial [Burkholderiales bacterium]
IDQVFADPQVQHLGIAQPIDHPKYGPQKVVGQPIHLSRYSQPEKLKHTPAPGEHTDEILKGLGYDEAAIAALREKRVV